MNSTQQVSNPFFARVWTVMSAHETEALTRLRRENLAGLSGRVLEVGAGTGTNFAHYPDTVEQVLAVEPEAALLVHARSAAEAAPVPVRVTGETIENLSDPGPFDAVVCSLVLCTVADADSVVQQLFSRLTPGGELRYMEHVASAVASKVLPMPRSGRGCSATAIRTATLSTPSRPQDSGSTPHAGSGRCRDGCWYRSPNSRWDARSSPPDIQPSNAGSSRSSLGSAVLALSRTVTVAASDSGVGSGLTSTTTVPWASASSGSPAAG